MGRFVNPDNSAFQVALNSKIYVDKTGLIEYTNSVLDTTDAYICNSRPRRFGKSYAANMLAAYYSKGADSEKMFSGLQISKEADFREHLNKYDVIHIDIQWFLANCEDVDNVVTLITDSVLGELREIYPNIFTWEVSRLPDALSIVREKTGQKFIIIIDEWDVLIRDAATNGKVQEAYINFLRGMFKGTEPTKYIQLAYLTGILPVKKEKTQSALNNFDEFTMLSASNLAPYIGFTEDEVEKLSKEYHQDFDKVKRWYDGYLLKDYQVYNPRAVVGVMLKGEFKSYWSETASYEAVTPLINMNYDGLKNAIIEILSGASIKVGDQCDILCNLIIRENYLNDTDSEVVNSKLELFSNVYNGRILLADRDFKIVSDTFHTEEGKTLLSSLAVACLKGEETSNYDARSKVLELAVPVQSPDVQQLQGVMLVSVSAVDIAETLAEMEQRGVMLIGSIVVLSVFLAWLLSTILVKPLARVTKAIEDLTDGMLDEEISVPDYTETELITDAFNKMVNRMKILDESRQEFVSNVSHELKTPLTSISGYAELIETGMASEQDTVRFAHGIHNSANRLLTLINDIIRLSELDGTEEEADTELLNLHEMAQNCVEMLKMSAEKHNVTIALNGTECYVTANRQMMEELLYNLCDNAIRYNNPGGSVDVQTYSREGHTNLVVKDTGIGISKEHQERIFERFYRVDKSRSKSTGGTGLGLAIVKHIIAKSHAELQLESEPGKGTTIRVIF